MTIYRLCIIILIVMLLNITPTFAFDWHNDISAKFFWTKAYKEKHPKPKNNMPKTMQDYYREVNKASDNKNNIPEPKFEKDTKLVDLPEPKISLVKYNDPPGKIEINLNTLRKKRFVNSIAVMSPSTDQMVYTKVFYHPSTRSAATELYLMKLNTTRTLKDRIAKAHINEHRQLLYRTGMDRLEPDLFKTLTIIDWSKDGTKLALKEKISYAPDGTWKTNLLIYDFNTGKMKTLNTIREAIKYYWRENQDLDFTDYRWDIYPIGWDAINPDRIIILAYASTGEKPKFLGSWSIDFEGKRAMLMSLTETNFEITQSGMCLDAEEQ